jgi:ABC-type glycerol-3-phosphate transport system permease component
MELLHQMTIGSWKPNNRMVAIVLFIFVFQDWNSFHWPNALSTNGDDKCVTSLESNCFGFSSMVLRALSSC